MHSSDSDSHLKQVERTGSVSPPSHHIVGVSKQAALTGDELELTFAIPDRPMRRGVSVAERGVIGSLPLEPGIACSASFDVDVMSSTAASLPKPAHMLAG